MGAGRRDWIPACNRVLLLSFKDYLSLLMAVWDIEVEISEVSEIFFL